MLRRHAALQLNKWDSGLHISTVWKIYTCRHPRIRMPWCLREPECDISLGFVADILMLFKVTPGRPNAVCSPAKQKFSAVGDWFCFSSHGGVDFVRERWQEKALEGDFSLKKMLWEKWKWWEILVSGHARLVGGVFFCRSCGTRWLEPQSAWTAVAARSKLQWWLNSLGRVTKGG